MDRNILTEDQAVAVNHKLIGVSIMTVRVRLTLGHHVEIH